MSLNAAGLLLPVIDNPDLELGGPPFGPPDISS